MADPQAFRSIDSRFNHETSNDFHTNLTESLL